MYRCIWTGSLSLVMTMLFHEVFYTFRLQIKKKVINICIKVYKAYKMYWGFCNPGSTSHLKKLCLRNHFQYSICSINLNMDLQENRGYLTNPLKYYRSMRSGLIILRPNLLKWPKETELQSAPMSKNLARPKNDDRPTISWLN